MKFLKDILVTEVILYSPAMDWRRGYIPDEDENFGSKGVHQRTDTEEYRNINLREAQTTLWHCGGRQTEHLSQCPACSALLTQTKNSNKPRFFGGACCWV